jgi:hypothetical protein
MLQKINKDNINFVNKINSNLKLMQKYKSNNYNKIGGALNPLNEPADYITFKDFLDKLGILDTRIQTLNDTNSKVLGLSTINTLSFEDVKTEVGLLEKKVEKLEDNINDKVGMEIDPAEL